MSAYPSFSTRIIGQTEKTLNAILDRELAGPAPAAGTRSCGIRLSPVC